jgi:hypothetical protein
MGIGHGFRPGGRLQCRSSSVVISPPDGRHLRRGLLSARGFVRIFFFFSLVFFFLIHFTIQQKFEPTETRSNFEFHPKSTECTQTTEIFTGLLKTLPV